MQENFISSSSSVKTRLKILHFYRFFRRNGSSPEICFNDGRCVSPAWVSDLLGDFHKNQEKVLKFLVEIVTKLQVIATERFLKEQKTDLSKWKSSSRGCVFGPLITNWIWPLSPNYYVKAVYVTCNWYFRQLMLYKVKREISIFFKMVGLAPQRRLHLQKSSRRAQNDFVRLFEILENTSDEHYRYLFYGCATDTFPLDNQQKNW